MFPEAGPLPAGVLVAVLVPPCGVTVEVDGWPDGGIWAPDCPEVAVAVPVPAPTGAGFAPANTGDTGANTIAATANVRTMVIESPFGNLMRACDWKRNADAMADNARMKPFMTTSTALVPSLHDTQSAIRRRRWWLHILLQR